MNKARLPRRIQSLNCHVRSKINMLGSNFQPMVLAIFIFAASGMQLHAQTADATSLNNKVMAGYQGWFRTPGDRPGNAGWAHWFNSTNPSARSLAFDTWPDMSGYAENEKYAVPGFTNSDGSQ